MGLFDRIKQALSPSTPEPRPPLFQRLEVEMAPEPVKEPEPIPEVVIPTPPVASASKGGLNPLRKKPLITPEMEARIKAKEERKKANAEKRRQKEQAKLAPVLPPSSVPDFIVPPVPEAIVKSEAPAQLVSSQWKPGQSGNPAGRPKTKHVKDALEKIIAQAKASNSTDPLVSTRLESLVKKIYDMAMDPDAELDEVLEAAKFISERLEGKPTQDVVDDEGSGKPELTININATRFAVQPDIGVIDVG